LIDEIQTNTLKNFSALKNRKIKKKCGSKNKETNRYTGKVAL